MARADGGLARRVGDRLPRGPAGRGPRAFPDGRAARARAGGRDRGGRDAVPGPHPDRPRGPAGAEGVRLHAYTKVDAVDPERATVTADGRILGADVVAVTAGAWADRLAPELRALATPSRQAVLYLAPPPRLAAAWAEAPVLAHLGDEGGNYTLPPTARHPAQGRRPHLQPSGRPGRVPPRDRRRPGAAAPGGAPRLPRLRRLRRARAQGLLLHRRAARALRRPAAGCERAGWSAPAPGTASSSSR